MPTPAPSPQQQDRQQRDRLTRGARDAVLGRQTLLLPLDLVYVASFVHAADVSRPGSTLPVLPLWSAGEVVQVLAAADNLLRRTLGVQLDCPRPRAIALPTTADHALVNFMIGGGADAGGFKAALHRRFETLLRRATPAADEAPTTALLLNLIYHDNAAERQRPESSTTRGLALPAAGDVERPSARVLLGYFQDRKRPRPAALTRFSGWVPSFFADTALAGAVLAHELGHSFGLEHDETAVAGKPNLMSAVIDEPPPGAAAPASVVEFGLDEATAARARRAGLQTGRLREN
jgi:hypothetical protein